jgi:O-antigen/teichoic acid export membrane protein
MLGGTMSITSRPVEEEPAAGGWAAFAGTALALAGVFGLIWGVAAVSDASYFAEHRPLAASLETWGWIAIVFGVLQLLGAVLVSMHRAGGAVIALVLGIVGLVAGFMTVAAFPLWGVTTLAINVLMIWAVCLHGEQFVR